LSARAACTSRNRRIDLLQPDLVDTDSGSIGIEYFPHQFLHRLFRLWRAAVKSGWMSDRPTMSRMALSATSFTVMSGFWILKRYLCTS
jgi:hypothetical protein